MFLQVSVCPQGGGVHPAGRNPLGRRPRQRTVRIYWNAFLIFVFKLCLMFYSIPRHGSYFDNFAVNMLNALSFLRQHVPEEKTVEDTHLVTSYILYFIFGCRNSVLKCNLKSLKMISTKPFTQNYLIHSF